MKKVYVYLILTAFLLLFFFSGCDQEAEIPALYFDGNISDMYEKSDVRDIAFSYVEGDRTITGFAKIKIQGTSSIGYEKKNYTVNLYKDSDYEQKLEIDVGWGEHSKYCLKANWIDKTHARNVVTAKLVTQVQQKYGVLTDAPRSGAIDGFPVEIYSNGEFLGLYTFNIPKDAWQFGMDSDNPDHIVICGEGWDLANCFWAEPDFQTWSVEVGQENDATLQKMKELFHFVMDSTDEEFTADFEKHLDLDAALNYYILADFACLTDNIAKNMLLATYDGTKWYMSLYDLDTSWGTSYDGNSLYDYENMPVNLWINQIFYRKENCFEEQLADRYFELREDILTKEHVMEEFNAFRAMIPEDSFEKEIIRWGTEIPGYDYSQIEEYLNTIIPMLDQKYEDWNSWTMAREKLTEYWISNFAQ